MPQSKKELVKAYLRENPDKTPEEVANKLGVSITTVRRAMKELETENTEVESMGVEDPFEEDVRKLKQKMSDEEEEEPEEAEIDPRILEFLRFLRTYISMTVRKYNFIKKLLIEEGPGVLTRPNDLEEILCDIAGLSRTRVRAVLKRWYTKKSQEASEEVYPVYYPQGTGGYVPYTGYVEEPVPPQAQTGGQPGVQPVPMYQPPVSDTDVLKKKIADAIDRISAAAVFQIMGNMATGRSNMTVAIDEHGRPVIRPAGAGGGGVTREEVVDIVKNAIKEAMESVNKNFQLMVQYIQQQNQQKQSTQENAMMELMKMMYQQLLAMTAQKQSDSSDKMMDRFLRMMETMMKSRGSEEQSAWREVLNMMKSNLAQQMSPLELIGKAIDLVERKILHGEKKTELDVKLAEVEAQKDIAQRKLALEEKKLEKETEKDLKMAELLKDLIDSIGRDVAERLIDKVPDVVAGFIEGMKKKKETGEFPSEFLRKVPTEELIETKKILEEAPEEKRAKELDEILKRVDEELARRELDAEKKAVGEGEGTLATGGMEKGQ